MNEINSNRKKVYIVCCFGEYQYVWEHLHDLIDTKKEELILPLGFMEYEKTKKELEKITMELSQELNINYADMKDAVLEQFLHNKFNHFKEYIEDAKKVVCLLPEHAPCYPDDIDEKNQEIEHCISLKNKVIKITNLKPKQKVIKF